ncbi:DUF5107 domain-containing protein [Mucilaginibacter sp. 10I4]|uniref:DUF5107 domain-containing protein n=1 Tax=Mucilaginibacter sp. 10I4 TaxID=3048580 RepID=UPI002B22B59D|nr:DUF5107 domain-containing protein [Mucilaginibacter sp. 10I4]MEB0262050.1 DUF5107 domain-containing protein [Mucilaginibacter sp. 10I4]
MQVKAWIEKVTIPTYEVGTPDKNPMFFEKRVYQGSSGVVYPNPIIEKISDTKVDREYTGLFLENAYLKIMIFPELGGRVQMAFDKIRNRHFIYYNQVIKPALVGLCGPWISGGIEFNWPQHHRPSTFDPVDYEIEQNKDGSITIWVNEVERMFHTKGMAGFTLHPDFAYLEIKAKLANPTALPQTFLWWANPAVKVNDHYQSVFPPDVNAVFDHGKRDVSSFPIATGTYYKVDYSPGTDISMYKNIPVPTSYMAVNSAYDFVGGYEHDTNAGMLHVANHHISPGKKQWTWGNGDFGVAWDRNLTDEDGPYIELMTGMFTDNQPDFTWLMPFEEKSFTQYFMPYTELGLVKNASKDLLLNMVTEGNSITVKLYATTMFKNITVAVYNNLSKLFDVVTNLDAAKIFEHTRIILEQFEEEDLAVYVTTADGIEILNYRVKQPVKEIPRAALPALDVEDLNSPEKLFLTGQHLEQYRHATFDPVPYYQKALEIDPADIRNNNALGAWYLRRGRFEDSAGYFRKAINTLTERNPNPYDGEAYFNLGLSLWYQEKISEAYDAFFKATWNSAWQDAAYYYVALIDLRQNNYEKALVHIEWSIDRNARNGKNYIIKSQALRRAGKFKEAFMAVTTALDRDKFNYAALYEQYLCFSALQDEAQAALTIQILLKRSRGTAHNLIECAISYLEVGFYDDAAELLLLAEQSEYNSPLINYYLAYAYDMAGNKNVSGNYLMVAAAADPGWCFPNRLQDIMILQWAAIANPADGKALYLLGNLYYDKRQYHLAIEKWKCAYVLNPDFATVNRNLGIALFNKAGDPDNALYHYEKAFDLNTADARVLMELDQLYKRLNRKPEERLGFLETNRQTAIQRDDIYLEMASLYHLSGKPEVAYDMLSGRIFHPWEGGEGKVSGLYVSSLTALAKKELKAERFLSAISLLQKCFHYPENLGEGKLPGIRENEAHYWLGLSLQANGSENRAFAAFRKGLNGDMEPRQAIFYNDSPPEKIFYQGLSFLKFEKKQEAYTIFEKLISYGHQHLNDVIKIDYFAVSLPDLMVFDGDLNLKNKIHCLYLMGLGHLGLNNKTEASFYFREVLDNEASHAGARNHLDLLGDEQLLYLIFHTEPVNEDH